MFIYTGSMSTSRIVEAQTDLWLFLPLLPSFLLFLVAIVGETNRAPFDLPEGEGELVGGFHTEYSSLKFALFFLAEYVAMFTVSALAVTLFLGGWMAPWPLAPYSPFGFELPFLGNGWFGAEAGRVVVQHRLLARAVVHDQDVGHRVRLLLAARRPAAAALRPVHEPRAGRSSSRPPSPGSSSWASSAASSPTRC